MPVDMNQLYARVNNHSDSDYYPRSRLPNSSQSEGKPCRACNDFKSWFKNQSDESKKKEVECPLSKSELGNKTWGFLHTMAAYFPNKPSQEEQANMTQFLRLFSRFYPCPTCAKDFSRLLDRQPPKTGSQTELAQWLCWAHNQVNVKLGKPRFDCSKVDERWKYGWKDGSCNV